LTHEACGTGAAEKALAGTAFFNRTHHGIDAISHTTTVIGPSGDLPSWNIPRTMKEGILALR
jgi:hypothetical protein